MANSGVEMYDRVRLPSGRAGRVVDQEQWRSMGVGMCRIAVDGWEEEPIWFPEEILKVIPGRIDPVRIAVKKRIERWKNGGCL